MVTTTTEPQYLCSDGYQILFIANPADPNYNPSIPESYAAGMPYANCNAGLIGDIKRFSNRRALALVDTGYAEFIIG